MPYSFTAIDFETAQAKHHSICQVGLVRVENGAIQHKISKLVCPPDNFYSYYNIKVHGITPDKTCDSPTFASVWDVIKYFIQDQIVVAHNGAFDFRCLKQTLQHYGIAPPVYEQRCTYRIYRKKLNVLCREYQIELNHHDALSDAMACAELYKLHLDSNFR